MKRFIPFGLIALVILGTLRSFPENCEWAERRVSEFSP